MTDQSNQQHRGGRTAPNNNGGGKQAAKAPSGNGSSSSSRGGSPPGGPPAAGGSVSPQLPDDDPFPSGAGLVWQTDILSKKWFGTQVQELCDAHEFDLSDKPCWRRHKGVVEEFGGLVVGRLSTAIGPPAGGKTTAWKRDEQGGFERALPYLAACSKTTCSLDEPDHVAVNSARLYGTGSKAGTPPAPGGPKNKGGGAGQQSSPKAQVSDVVEVKPETHAHGADPVQSHRSAGVTEGAEAPEQEKYVRRAVYEKPSKLQADFKKRNGGRGIAVVTGDIRRQFPHLTLAEAQELLWRRDAEMVKAAALVDEGQVAPMSPSQVGVQDLPTESPQVEVLADPEWAADIARGTAVGHAQGIAFAEHLPPTPPDPRKEAAREKAEEEAAGLARELAGYQDPTKTRPPTLIALAKGCRDIVVLVAVAGAIHAPAEALNILSEHPDVEVAKAVAAAQAALPDEAAVRLADHPDVEVRRILAARPLPSDALQQAIVDQDDFQATFVLASNPVPMVLNSLIMEEVGDEKWLEWPERRPEATLDWMSLACGGHETLRDTYFDIHPETFDVFDDHPAERRRYFASAPEIADQYYSTRPEMRETDQPEAPDEPDGSVEPDGEASTGGAGGWRGKIKQTLEKMGEAAHDPDDPNEQQGPDPSKLPGQRWGRNRS